MHQNIKEIAPKLKEALSVMFSTYEGLDISSNVVLTSIENEMILVSRRVFNEENFLIDDKMLEFIVKVSLQIMMFKNEIRID